MADVTVTQADRDAVFAHWNHPSERRIVPITAVSDDHALVQAFARHRQKAAAEGRKEIIDKGCIHLTKAAERSLARTDIAEWQESQREFFNDTILEIVSEYAEWRDGRNGPDIANVARWLTEISTIDLAEIVADGGITAGMVIQQEAKNLADKLTARTASSDLTAASQLEHSGLISREKYNHIVENIRARSAIRECME